MKHGARCYYNILIDPWLVGGQSDVASWFSQQFHNEPSSVQSVAELEELMHEIEGLARRLSSDSNGKVMNDKKDTFIDALAISHEFTDHCHKETLLEIHPDVPVFAIKEAAKLIQSWKHFRTVTTVSVFGKDGNVDWRSTSIPPLPEYIGICRLLQTDDVLNYHAALMFTFNNQHGAASKLSRTAHSLSIDRQSRHHSTIEPDEDEESAEVIVYSPHGIHSGDLKFIPMASPSISTLAFLHGLHNVRVGTVGGRTALQSNLGAHNGLKAQRILNAKYWIGTHDEIKKGGGLVAWFLQRDVITLKDALEQEQQEKEGDVYYIELLNGESRVLS